MNIKTAVLRELRRARSFYDTSMSQNNEDALHYYNSQQPSLTTKDVPVSVQNVVSPDVANAVDHTLADIMPAFASESPVSFVPTGPEDEVQTQVETQLVNNIFMQQSNGFSVMLTAFQDALLRRIGVIEVQTNEKISVSYLSLDNITFDVLSSYMSKGNVDVIKINGQAPEEIDFESLATFSVELRQTTKIKQLHIQAVEPDELLIPQDSETLDLDDVNFVARERLLTRSELVELGYDKAIVEELPTYSYYATQKASRLRKNDLQENTDDTHTSTENIRVAVCYIRIDEDGDGIAELRKIVLAGNVPDGGTILENVPCDSQPFAIGVPFLYAHRTYGTSLFDKIKQTQDIKTKVTQLLLTAGYRAARGRIGVVNSQANLKDIAESEFGGVVRMTTPNGIVPIPQDVFPSDVAALLQQADKGRRESGGSAIDKASEDILIGGDTAHGLERIMSAMEQLNSLVAKLLAETLLKQVYRKIHANLRKHFSEKVTAKVEGHWLVSTPADWPTRTHVTTAAGLTMGDRLRQAASYEKLLLEQLELAKNGSITVNAATVYNLQIARANSLMLPGAHKFYISPFSPEGKQAAERKQQQAEEQKQQQEQLAMGQYQMMMQIETVKAQSNAQVQTLKNQIKEVELLLKSATDDKGLTLGYEELRMKLVELNAKYDAEKVPDALPRQPN